MRSTKRIALVVGLCLMQSLLGASSENNLKTKESSLSFDKQPMAHLTHRLQAIGDTITTWCQNNFVIDTAKEMEAEVQSTVAPDLALVKKTVSENILEVQKNFKKRHLAPRKHSHRPPRFECPPYVSRTIWDAMRPYFLPRSHPLRTKLDAMFTKKRVTANSHTLTAEGFYGRKGNRAGRFSHATVACHEKFSGYILKFFTDDSPHSDWQQLKKRIDGSISLQKSIDSHGWQKWFKTPKKWIYPLPASPAPIIVEGIPVKGFILVAEDMLLLKRSQNYMRWRQTMTPAKLDALYTLLQEQGLLDSVYPFNIPFCFDGRIAFIDLEHNHLWPVPFYKMQTYLSPALQPYWESITSNAPDLTPTQAIEVPNLVVVESDLIRPLAPEVLPAMIEWP